MSWRTTTIGNLVESGFADIQTGPFGTQLRASDYVEDGIPVINVRNIGFGCVKMDKIEFVSEETSERLASHILEKDDIVFGRKGAVDRHLFVGEAQEHWMQGSDCIRLRFLTDDVVPRFVSYAFLSPIHQQWMLNQAGNKATMASLNHDVIKRISLRLPPTVIQERIVDVVSQYDELIDNNRRRIALLEDVARQLYKEWFVRLRFPGREHTRIVDGIPRGWSRQSLAELCDSIDYGYTASAQLENVGPKFLRITDIVPSEIDWASVPHCEIEERRLSRFRLIEGDIVVARTGATVGFAKRLHKRHSETVFASYLVRLRPSRTISNLLMGVFVESDSYKGYVQSRIGGAAQPNANAKVLSAAKILVPPTHLQRQFDDFVEPLFDQREVLQLQNAQLIAARDLLLPRLMSGEIAV